MGKFSHSLFNIFILKSSRSHTISKVKSITLDYFGVDIGCLVELGSENITFFSLQTAPKVFMDFLQYFQCFWLELCLQVVQVLIVQVNLVKHKIVFLFRCPNALKLLVTFPRQPNKRKHNEVTLLRNCFNFLLRIADNMSQNLCIFCEAQKPFTFIWVSLIW